MLYKLFLLYYLYKSDTSFFLLTFYFILLFTRCATSNASRHFKSPLAMGRDAFKPKHASSVSISGVIDTGVNSNLWFSSIRSVHSLYALNIQQYMLQYNPQDIQSFSLENVYKFKVVLFLFLFFNTNHYDMKPWLKFSSSPSWVHCCCSHGVRPATHPPCQSAEWLTREWTVSIYSLKYYIFKKISWNLFDFGS